MECQKCGAKNNFNKSFCTNCGTEFFADFLSNKSFAITTSILALVIILVNIFFPDYLNNLLYKFPLQHPLFIVTVILLISSLFIKNYLIKNIITNITSILVVFYWTTLCSLAFIPFSYFEYYCGAQQIRIFYMIESILLLIAGILWIQHTKKNQNLLNTQNKKTITFKVITTYLYCVTIDIICSVYVFIKWLIVDSYETQIEMSDFFWSLYHQSTLILLLLFGFFAIKTIKIKKEGI